MIHFSKDIIISDDIPVRMSIYFFFAEESLDVDPNYDPSDFLMAGLPQMQSQEVKLEDDEIGKIHDDLAVSESEDEGANDESGGQQLQEEDDGGELWF